MSEPAGWSARLQSVGHAFLALVRAEIAELVADLGRSGRSLVRALVLLGGAFAVAFWTLGLLLYFLVELLALTLPRWGAVGIVLALFVLLAALLVTVALRRIAAIEAPDETVRRRLAESQRWWQERVAAGDSEPADEPDELNGAEGRP